MKEETKKKISEALKKFHKNNRNSEKYKIKQFNIKTHLQALDCKELWNLNNGVTLCEDCHKRVHKRQVI